LAFTELLIYQKLSWRWCRLLALCQALLRLAAESYWIKRLKTFLCSERRGNWASAP